MDSRVIRHFKKSIKKVLKGMKEKEIWTTNVNSTERVKRAESNRNIRIRYMNKRIEDKPNSLQAVSDQRKKHKEYD